MSMFAVPTILGIDPGPEQSGVCFLRGGQVEAPAVLENTDVLHLIFATRANLIAIEMIASYGMPVGSEVFDTCRWIGRFEQAAALRRVYVELIFRRDVKLHLCGTARAKDPNIRQRLIDLFGPPGTKRQPGGTYGVKSHAWAALAVAKTAVDSLAPRQADLAA